jgi:DNA invertase Pin-like site-specific DNA recombinase
VIYGYARVSTDAQTLDAQIAALTAAGAVKVFSEKESGAKTRRMGRHDYSARAADADGPRWVG